MKKFLMALFVMTSLLTACSSTTPINPNKPEMSVDDRYPHPKTFNQYHNRWNE